MAGELFGREERFLAKETRTSALPTTRTRKVPELVWSCTPSGRRVMDCANGPWVEANAMATAAAVAHRRIHRIIFLLQPSCRKTLPPIIRQIALDTTAADMIFRFLENSKNQQI
jgi:hypothetical protein